MTPARRLLAAILVGFAAVAFVNIAWEIQLPHQAEGVLLRDDDRLSTLIGTEVVLARERFWIPSALLEAGSGGVLVVPDEELVDPYYIGNLSRMELLVEDYDPELSAAEAAALRDFPLVEGFAGLHPRDVADPRPFLVVWIDDGRPAAMRVWYRGDSVYAVDDRIIAELRS